MSFLRGRVFSTPYDFNGQLTVWLTRPNERLTAGSSARSTASMPIGPRRRPAARSPLLPVAPSPAEAAPGPPRP